MKTFFIVGTNTGVGKTFLTAALAWQLRHAGKRICALKPVISGFNSGEFETSDTGQLLSAQGLALTPQNARAISPWRMEAQLSPDMAAEDEEKPIDTGALVAFCTMQRDCDTLLIESAGGIMTPLNASHTMLDWADALKAPLILVAGSYLGTISHTLTACAAILARGVALAGIVISASRQQGSEPARLQASLRRFLPQQVSLHYIRRLDVTACAWKDAPDLASILL